MIDLSRALQTGQAVFIAVYLIGVLYMVFDLIATRKELKRSIKKDYVFFMILIITAIILWPLTVIVFYIEKLSKQ